MLAVEGLTIRFGDKPLLDGVGLRVNAGQRVALAGRNGQGKSTLFRCITGEQGFDRGTISMAKGRTVGYLPQDILPPDDERSAIEEVLSGIPELGELEILIHRLTERLSHGDDDPALLKRYGKAQARFEALDGYGVEAKGRTILHGLGFSQERMDGPLNQLSGGWLMRTQLARLLLMNPDLLLLDEPTNHLDIESREWLLGFLQGFDGGLILVSHDRYFLDSLVTKVIELEGGKLEVYAGNYTKYEEDKAARLHRLKAAHSRQQKELERQLRFIEKNRAKAATASNVQSRIKQVEKIEVIELPPEAPRIRLRFPEPEKSGALAFRLTDLGKSYGPLDVFSGLTLEMDAGQKLVVTGVNGAGKTTLLKLLTGRETPTRGTVELGHNVSLQYFSQYEDDIADTSRTLLQCMEEVTPSDPLHQPRTVLGCFLFSGDDAFKPVKVLSGGERARLKMARMLMQPSNLLVMDEPTNHLDLHSKDLLLQALKDYKGSAVFVSHDRDFIRQLATCVLHIEGGRKSFHPCTYEQFRWRQAQDAAAEKAAVLEREAAATRAKEKARKKSANAAPKPGDQAKKKKKSKNKKEDDRELKRQHRRVQKRVDGLQERIEAEEAQVAELEALMGTPGFFEDTERSQAVVTEHKMLQVTIGAAYGELEEALEALDALPPLPG
jgi:ATP-binding cassette, subfamily F, member 3